VTEHPTAVRVIHAREAIEDGDLLLAAQLLRDLEWDLLRDPPPEPPCPDCQARRAA
jgi:hypothetical protein